ncbi:MAG: transcription termination/antitermination protein NusG, partial [Crocinitomicaceae bacterium]
CRPSELAKLFDIQGFHSILPYLKKPAIVRDYEIENIKILLKESDSLTPYDNVSLIPGERVEVIRGPFQGLIATSLEVNRTYKLIVEIESLEQRFVVHIPKSFVQKL